jgi:catechol 2,3-dioxygenase-like lactoylglutathione lyase family enzyme
MRIEHIGIQIEDPAAMGDWYVKHLGFVIKRSADAPVPVRFIADLGGQMMLEIYRNPKARMPDYRSLDPLLFHIAFTCDEVDKTIDRLVTAGAILYSDSEITPGGDTIAFLRDPWGLPIQLVNRKQSMI